MKKSVLKTLCDFDKKGLVFPLLPRWFKWISIGIVIAGALLFFTRTTIDVIPELFSRQLATDLMTIGLLLCVLTKEKYEDERIQNLRFRSFAFAFVLSIVFFVVVPWISGIIDFIKDAPVEIDSESSLFYVFSMTLFFQIMYFETFKRQL